MRNMLLRFHRVLFGLQEDAQLQWGSSGVSMAFGISSDSNTQTRVQLQEYLPEPKVEDNIHVNPIQYFNIIIA